MCECFEVHGGIHAHCVMLHAGRMVLGRDLRVLVHNTVKAERNVALVVRGKTSVLTIPSSGPPVVVPLGIGAVNVNYFHISIFELRAGEFEAQSASYTKWRDAYGCLGILNVSMGESRGF
jgi:hypothetical protein